LQAHLEAEIPFNQELHNGMAIDTCVENFSGAVLMALAASNPKRRPRDDPRAPTPAGIQNEIRLKKRLRRQWQVTKDPALKSRVQPPKKVGDPQSQRVEERRVGRDTPIP
jgi:hypothetical protein